MGKAKKRWTSEEEAALSAGVYKYGTGKWKDILNDHQFSHCLINRSNVDLKDKWRNLGCNASNSQGSSRRHTGSSYMRQMWRMVGSKKRLCQITMIIVIILTMLGLLGMQTQYWNKRLLPLMLTIWLERWYMMPSKTWKDLKTFLKRLWRFYKWLQSFNQHVKVHRMV